MGGNGEAFSAPSGLFSGNGNSNDDDDDDFNNSNDGDEEEIDKEEQENCNTVYCNFGGNYMCLDESWVCDEVVDCSNGKDEEDCPSVSPMKSGVKVSLLNDTMEKAEKDMKRAEEFHTKVATLLGKTSAQYNGNGRPILFPGDTLPGGEFNDEWQGNTGPGASFDEGFQSDFEGFQSDFDEGFQSDFDEGFQSDFYDNEVPVGRTGGRYGWENARGRDGQRPGKMGKWGGRGKLSPAKLMMMKIFARLSSGASAEDLEELSFLDLKIREQIKKVFTMAVTGDWPKFCLPFRMWNSSGSEQFAGSTPFGMEAESIIAALDFYKTNVTAQLEASLQGNETMLDFLKLSGIYMDIIKLHVEDITSVINTAMQLFMNNPQEVKLLTKTPGPEPTDDMNCRKKAMRTIALLNPEDDDEEEKFFKNPFEQFMALTKQDPKPFFWVIEDGGIFRGERSDVTGSMFYDKVAVCSCKNDDWNSGYSPKDNSGWGEDGNGGSDWGGSGWKGSSWGGSGWKGSNSGGSGWKGSGWGGSGWGMGSSGGFNPGFGSGGGFNPGFGSGGGFNPGFGSGDGFNPGFGSGDGFSGGFGSGPEMWMNSNLKKGENDQIKLNKESATTDKSGSGSDQQKPHAQRQGQNQHNGKPVTTKQPDLKKPSNSGHGLGTSAKSLNPGNEDYFFGSSLRKKRNTQQNKIAWAKTNIQLKNSNMKTSEGMVSVEGQIVVTVNKKLEQSSVCDDGDWGVEDAKVVCKSLLWQHIKDGHHLLSAIPTSVPADPEGPKVRISGLNCLGHEENILKCKFLRDQKCKVKEIAGVKCVIK
ncbi:uncharacterized protein [Palaemon carinicauda]|uniref:uncharacterized protein n=1 Tax=Palaemon carinicauda TaxID=392227 RepID=UPI0035B6223D